MTDIPCYRV